MGKKHLAVFAGGESGVEAVKDGTLYLYDIEEGEWRRVNVIGDVPPVTQGHVLTSLGSKVGF